MTTSCWPASKVWVPRRAPRRKPRRLLLGSWSPQRGQRLAHPAEGDRGQKRRVFVPRSRGTSRRTRVRLLESNRTGARRRRALPSRPREHQSRSGSTSAAATPSPARRPSGTRLAPWRFVPLFARGTVPSYGAAHGGAAHRNPAAYGFHVVAALPKGVTKGRSWRSSSRGFPTRSSILGGLPGALPGSRGSPLSSGLGGVTLDGVEMPTPKVRAAWASDVTPRPRASTIFRRRALEYAFIAPCCHVAHPHRNTM